MSGITVVAKFQFEIMSEALAQEMFPLLKQHWTEIAHYPDIELNVDWPAYYLMQEKGILRVYTAREQNGNLIGYSAFIIRFNPHYAQSKNALQDVIFIDPSKRGFGKRFIAWCDEQLKQEDVQLVFHHVKQAHNWGPMLESMDYELVDLIYAKRLDVVAPAVDSAGISAAHGATGRAL